MTERARRRAVAAVILGAIAVGTARASVSASSDGTVSRHAKAFGSAVKRDSKAVGAGIKEGAHRVAVASKAVGHEIAVAAKHSAAVTRAAFHGETPAPHGD